MKAAFALHDVAEWSLAHGITVQSMHSRRQLPGQGRWLQPISHSWWQIRPVACSCSLVCFEECVHAYVLCN